MDDSRSVQQPDLPDSGRSSHPFLNPSFSCRVCGGADFTVETRAGDQVWLSSLRFYQQVFMGPFPGTHNVYTCARCVGAVDESRKSLRDDLLGKLLFAAKHLAERQFTRGHRVGQADLICVECRTVQVGDGRLRHATECCTGRVLGLLEALMQLDDPSVLQDALKLGGESPLPLVAAAAELGGAR